MSVEFTRFIGEDFGRLEISCDVPKCTSSDEFQGAFFSEAIREAKKNGWKNNSNGDGTYLNICPSCVESGVNLETLSE